MMHELFAHPERLWLLALLPAAVLAAAMARRARRRALSRFAGTISPDRLVPGYWPASGLWRTSMSMGGIGFLIIALARPQWGERSEPVVRRGVDIVIALDTSRSMGCEDVRPDRFERARLAIADLLERRAGDRIALLPFSDQAAFACPLTLDYGAVRLFLDAAEIAPAGSSGTDLATAIRSSLRTFDSREKKHKVLVLLTDGEDHGGEAVAAAEEARRDGVIIYALGVGTPAGGPIPVRDERAGLQGYHRDEAGAIVTSRLDETLLAKVCGATGGSALRLGGRGEEVIRLSAEIDHMEKKEQRGALATRREERYRWPLVAALTLLAGEAIVPRIRRRSSTGAAP